MFFHTVMLIDLIDPVDLPFSGQHGQHGQQPCANRLSIKLSSTHLAVRCALEQIKPPRTSRWDAAVRTCDSSSRLPQD